MKTQSRTRRYIFVIAWVLLVVLGAYTAIRTYQYEPTVKGMLGIAYIYLLLFYLRYSGVDASLNILISEPRNYRHFAFAFIGTCLTCWATISILDVISLLIKAWLLN